MVDVGLLDPRATKRTSISIKNVKVQHNTGKKLHKKFIIPTVKHGGFSIML